MNKRLESPAWVIGTMLPAMIATVAVLDLITKEIAVATLTGRPAALPVTPFFSLTLGYNAGISYGLFQAGTRTATLVILGATTVLTIAMTWIALRSSSAMERAGFGLIIGGAVGNIIDRARDGYVTDFLDLHVGSWHWPTFNIADSAITVGVALLVSGIVGVGAASPRLGESEQGHAETREIK